MGLSPRLYRIIVSIVKKEIPERIEVGTVAKILGMSSEEEPTWSNVEIRLRDLARVHRAARQGQPAESPVATLTALSAGESKSEPGIDRKNLALALGLSPESPEDVILGELHRLAELVYPGTGEAKELTSRLALIGLSATTATPEPLRGRDRLARAWNRELGTGKELRSLLVRSFSATLAPEKLHGTARTAAAFNVEHSVSKLSDSQVLALSISALGSRHTMPVTLSAVEARVKQFRIAPPHVILVDVSTTRSLIAPN